MREAKLNGFRGSCSLAQTITDIQTVTTSEDMEKVRCVRLAVPILDRIAQVPWVLAALLVVELVLL